LGDSAFGTSFAGAWPSTSQPFGEPFSFDAVAPEQATEKAREADAAGQAAPAPPPEPDGAARAPLDAFSDAYAAFVRKFQATLTSPAVQQRMTYAQTAYVQALQQAVFAPDVQQRVAAAYNEFVETIGSALGGVDGEESVAAVLGEYVDALRHAWLDARAETIDAPSLAAIAQSMTTVAWLAAAGGPGQRTA
jgi:hypothetical protein